MSKLFLYLHLLIFCSLQTKAQLSPYTSDSFRLFSFEYYEHTNDTNRIKKEYSTYIENKHQLFITTCDAFYRDDSLGISYSKIFDSINMDNIHCLVIENSYFYHGYWQYDFKILSQLKNVNSLYYHGCIEPEIIEQLLIFFPKLENLTIYRGNCMEEKRFQHRVFQAISKLKLKRLFVVNYIVDRKIVKYINRMPLEELSLYDPLNNIQLPSNAFNIKTLKTFFTFDVELFHFNKMLYKNTNLEELYLDNPRLVKLDTTRFKNCFPNLKEVNLWKDPDRDQNDQDIRDFFKSLPITYTEDDLGLF